MGEGRILVVEDDIDISKMLRIYFDSQGYEVLIANRGNEALEICRRKLPQVVLLDIQLPDLDGYEVCRNLKSHVRTAYVPVIFVTQEDKRGDKIAGLELGADDYITKPFDIEELKLRMEGAIRRSQRKTLTHPISNLPTGKSIEEKLKQIKDSSEPWLLLYFGIRNIAAFREVANFIYVNEVIIFLADVIREGVEAYGTMSDFIGQASDNDFIIITAPEAAPSICKRVTQQFDEESKNFYSFHFREQGKVTYQDTDGSTKEADFMKLEVGIVSNEDGPFADIVQITEDAYDNRQRNRGCPEESKVQLTVSPIKISSKEPQKVLAIKTKEKLEGTREENLDYLTQLKDQYFFWEKAPLFIKALFKINALISGKIHDMSQIGRLLDLADGSKLPTETRADLQIHQQHCLLAYENLNELRFKVLNYQEFEPASIVDTLKNISKLLPELKVKSLELTSEPEVAVPEHKLQQAIYNICKWLRLQKKDNQINVSIKPRRDTISVIFTAAHIGELETSISSPISLHTTPFIVYGYLAQKAISRYQGSVESSKDQVTLNLPLPEYSSQTISKISDEELQKGIEIFWLRQRSLEITVAFEDAEANIQARDLAGVVAEDLLDGIEAMLEVLETSPDIDLNNKASPWSAIRRKLRFFQILTMDFRRNYKRNLTQENLKDLLDDVKVLLTHRVIDHDIVIESDVLKPVIKIERMRFLQILVNLGLNALEAMPEGGLLKFHIKQISKYYLVEVIDNGRGISQDHLSHIFDLGFTTKVKGPAQGSGRGIGLHSVKTYVEELDGQIEVSSEVGKGTTFTVKLPIH